MPTRARSLRRNANPSRDNTAIAGDRGTDRAVARRPVGAPKRPAKPSGFGEGVLASAEQEASQASFVRNRLANPYALFMVGLLAYAVYKMVAAMFMAR